MAAVNADQLDDLVALTFNTVLGRRTWTDISLANQHYTISPRFFRGKKLPTDSGPRMEWKLQVRNQANTRLTALFDRDRLGIQNLMITGKADWAMVTTNYSYDVGEPDFQSDDQAKIVDSLLTREHSMYNEWFEFLESKLWSSPATSTGLHDILGIPHWIVKHATVGFNGGNPSGWSSGAGEVSSTTYDKWRNRTGAYVGVTRDDLITKALNSMDFCNFRPPHAYPQTNGMMDPVYALYTTHVIVEQLLRYLDSKNDNIRDAAGVAASGTAPMLRGTPVEWVPELSNAGQPAVDTSNPFYGVDWNSMKLRFLRGKEMNRQGPLPVAGQRNVRAVHVESSLQLVCTNRRTNFVHHQA